MKLSFRVFKTTRLNTSSLSLIYLIACLGTQIAMAAPADHFVTTWKTDNPGTSGNTSITIPMVGGPYDVDWDNDGAFDDLNLNGPVTHNFGLASTYMVRIRGLYDSKQFAFDGDKDKIVAIDQWGTNAWTTMQAAFAGAVNLEVPAPDTPDFSAVMDMSWMFSGATSFDRDIGSWDVSSLTDATGMFDGVALSTANYDSLLTDWNAQALQPNVTFDGGNSVYCSPAAIAARANMIASDMWDITDSGQCAPPTPAFEVPIPVLNRYGLLLLVWLMMVAGFQVRVRGVRR